MTITPQFPSAKRTPGSKNLSNSARQSQSKTSSKTPKEATAVHMNAPSNTPTSGGGRRIRLIRPSNMSGAPLLTERSMPTHAPAAPMRPPRRSLATPRTEVRLLSPIPPRPSSARAPRLSRRLFADPLESAESLDPLENHHAQFHAPFSQPLSISQLNKAGDIDTTPILVSSASNRTVQDFPQALPNEPMFSHNHSLWPDLLQPYLELQPAQVPPGNSSMSSNPLSIIELGEIEHENASLRQAFEITSCGGRSAVSARNSNDENHGDVAADSTQTLENGGASQLADHHTSLFDHFVGFGESYLDPVRLVKKEAGTYISKVEGDVNPNIDTGTFENKPVKSVDVVSKPRGADIKTVETLPSAPAPNLHKKGGLNEPAFSNLDDVDDATRSEKNILGLQKSEGGSSRVAVSQRHVDENGSDGRNIMVKSEAQRGTRINRENSITLPRRSDAPTPHESVRGDKKDMGSDEPFEMSCNTSEFMKHGDVRGGDFTSSQFQSKKRAAGDQGSSLKRKRRKRMSEVLRLKKSLATASWTNSVVIENLTAENVLPENRTERTRYAP